MDRPDNLDALYTSKNLEDIINFYNKFKTAEELIDWSKNRQRGRAKIRTVKGKTDIVVVIPTADIHGEYAENCKNNVFKGQQIVFVESGKNDIYFNYARNVNIGLKYALKYKPNWIILSNDDVYRIDNISLLKKNLLNLDNKMYDTVYIRPDPGFYHSNLVGIVKMSKLAKKLKTVIARDSRDRFAEKLRLDLIRRFNLKYQVRSGEKMPYKNKLFSFFSKLEYRPIEKWRNFGDFAIFSPMFIENAKGKPFDEIFLNGGEDYDLSKRVFDGGKWINIDFRIGSVGGGTFKKESKRTVVKNGAVINWPDENHEKGNTRKLQDVFNILYFDYKYRFTQKR